MLKRLFRNIFDRGTPVAAVSLAFVLMTMMTSNELSIYASSTTEDDGYTYPDDASEEEKEEVDEQEQEAWEDAGRPGEIDDNDENDDDEGDNDDDDNNDEEPYCDEVDSDYQGTCFDSQDYDDVTGLAPCKDGSQVQNYNDCPDRQDDKTKVFQKTTVIQSARVSPSATATAGDISYCKLGGSADGILQKFDIDKYQTCGLYTYADTAYYDGFVTGCMNVGNTKLICEAVANSNILNINMPLPQTPTTIPQSTQAIQPTATN